ncbi:MAG TPA: glycosyltransferase family 2 protein [Cyclobacteriaceae bacterium]|jgi:glycosyltransferase involved in cell wall biosynthesis|nr:glycosyltransferase family 2 protein [Cyclobacteriaceae bacterium]
MRESILSVSVIIPTYNYAQFISKAIDSILNQKYDGELEIIVVDDGSRDNTKEVLLEFIESGVVKYFYQENRGKAAATRTGILESGGEYIFNLDADDYFLPDKIARTVALYQEFQDVVHVANVAKFIINNKEAGHEIFPHEIVDRKSIGSEVLSLFYSNRVLFGGGSTFSARASVLKSIEIPDSVDMFIDEYLVLMTLSKGNCFFLSEPLSVWRGHQNNYTIKKLSSDNKSKRLLDSSLGILEAIKFERSMSADVKKLYSLHHYTRTLYFKELDGTKSFKDILSFVFFCFFKNRYGLKQLRTYSVFNRLLPTIIINFIKRNRK